MKQRWAAVARGSFGKLAQAVTAFTITTVVVYTRCMCSCTCSLAFQSLELCAVINYPLCGVAAQSPAH